MTAHSGGYLSVYQANGTPLPGWPQQPTPGNELRSLAVGDVDGNGSLEILTASTRPDNQWFLFNAGALGAPTLADIDGDGELEAVIGTAHTGLVAYSLPGTSKARVLWGTGRGSSLRTGQAANILGNIPKQIAFFYDIQQQRLSPAQYQVTPKNMGTTQMLQWGVVPSGNWFSLSPLSGATPSPFKITPENFDVQTPMVYQGSVALTVNDPPGATNSPVQIPLTLRPESG